MTSQFVAVRRLSQFGSAPDVEVLAVATDREELTGPDEIRHEDNDVLEIYFSKGARAPIVGERIGTYRDGSTLYAMAPRKEPAATQMMTVDQIDGWIRDNGVSAKDFWQEAAGGDKVSMSIDAVRRIGGFAA